MAGNPPVLRVDVQVPPHVTAAPLSLVGSVVGCGSGVAAVIAPVHGLLDRFLRPAPRAGLTLGLCLGLGGGRRGSPRSSRRWIGGPAEANRRASGVLAGQHAPELGRSRKETARR